MNLHNLQENLSNILANQKDKHLLKKLSMDNKSPNRVSADRLKQKKKVLIFASSIFFVATITIVISFLTSNNRLISKASCNEEALRVKQLIPLMEDKSNYLTKPYATSDFVNPWLFTDYTPEQITEYVTMLKNAGYQNIILQNIATLSGGDKNDAKITCAWYETTLSNDTNHLEIYNPTLLKNLIDALSENDMGIYIGIALSNDWLNDAFTNNAWKYNNAILINSIINEIYTTYGNYSCFKGWYLGYDIYPNNKGYEQHWIELLNYTLNYVTKLESNGQSHPILISPYFNENYSLKNNDIYAFWKNIIQKTNFRTGDIICLQDGLGTNKLPTETIYNYIKQTKKAIDSSDTAINFWLSVENFRDIETSVKPADLVKYQIQLDICSKLATHLASYSYSHYYNPTRVDVTYNTEYVKYFTETASKVKISNVKNSDDKISSKAETKPSNNSDTSEYKASAPKGISLEFENNTISTPEGGYVYKDKNNELAPIPAGFTVSSYANTIADGLVIIDKNQNEYVWIPVKNGIQPTGYSYSDRNKISIYYTRYIQNDIVPIYTTPDTLPFGVGTDTTQIEKYHGFYVGRYESSFNYNLGEPTCQIKYLNSCTSELSFNWKYSNSNTFTGYTWNNITYSDAKTIAENMSTKYSYHNSVKTGLINGTQWDTIMRWLETSSHSQSTIQNSTTWGNFTDSTNPAKSLNYQMGIIKSSGSNPNWSMKNIHDLAGNLSEWTNELSNNKYVTRSGSFNQSGTTYGASYAQAIANDEYSNVGFRVVLYID